jgi:hypothetical protein
MLNIMSDGKKLQAVEAAKPGKSSLGEIAKLFLKLGTIAFGGPAEHVAMMEDEVVRGGARQERPLSCGYLA